MQIGSNDRRIICVSLGKHHPVTDPAGFGIGRSVPQRGLSARIRPVPVEEDPYAALSGFFNQFIHDLNGLQTGKIGIFGIINTIGSRA
ncbi:hypothetical protein D3C81_1721300 [compost metagenome]